MIKITNKIQNGKITTLQGIILRNNEVVYFIFNGNKKEFEIKGISQIPTFGLFNIKEIESKETEISLEEIEEIKKYICNKRTSDLEKEFVESSTIDIVQYDNINSIMYITFKNGSKYQYVDIEREKYIELINAESVGSYYNNNIKHIYSHI